MTNSNIGNKNFSLRSSFTLCMLESKIRNNFFVSALPFSHVMLPKELSKLVPKDHLMSETEWRSIGVQQSRGWQHYLIHEPGK
jgi:cyclin-dependent kinase regulatory subunit CKS1